MDEPEGMYRVCTVTSVADPGCLSRILIFTFLFSLRCHKIEHYFSFEVQKKKIWANFQRIIELFTQKIVTNLSKYGLGIRDPEKKPIHDP